MSYKKENLMTLGIRSFCRNWLAFLILTSVTISCSDQDQEVPFSEYHRIQPYETTIQNMWFVSLSNSDTITIPISTSSPHIGYYERTLTNRFPNYLNDFIFRGFRRLGSDQAVAYLRSQDGVVTYDTTSIVGGALSGYPDFYYDERQDLFYKCNALTRTISSMRQANPTIYKITELSCNQPLDIISNPTSYGLTLNDSIIYQEVRLPFVKP